MDMRAGSVVSVNAKLHTVTGRIPIDELTPRVPGGKFPAKAVVGEIVPFEATVFREGHDKLGALLTLTAPDGSEYEHPMELVAPGTDRFRAVVRMDAQGTWSWFVTAYHDEWATWMHDAEIKIGADVDSELMLQIGAGLLKRVGGQEHVIALLEDRTRPAKDRWQAASSDAVAAAVAQRPPISLVTRSAEQRLGVERERAGVGAWYEFFPRSEGAKRTAEGWVSGTFATAAKRLPAVASMGFDVVYLPPIHPIGTTNRKGPNNTLTTVDGDPGSPWAIGAAEGGHDAVHPDLGTIDDFAAFVREAGERGLEIAMDLALQASPDHPWVREHPEWFTTLPDGSIAYAENPPKKYQDIYPINFDNAPESLAAEVLRIVEQWIRLGVQIFRVDNPHTKPVWFWEWLIRVVNDRHPDVVFLAEAFTRPAMMQTLGKVGFQQSYTYFTWRNTKTELEEYLREVSGRQADWFRPNFWVNTPDILTEYLQFGGVPAYKIRAAIAAIACPSWGMYTGYELIENVARPGAEENIDNEKYEYKDRSWTKPPTGRITIEPYITMLNGIRAAHPAIAQPRGTHVHASDDEAILVFSKHIEGRFTENGEPDTVIVVVNVDPHSARQTLIHLDMEAIGLDATDGFTAHDLVTGESWEWGRDNYVRLDSFVEPAHIVRVQRKSR
ncbi:alpha-1,4-glucan--maltose-1-phosphate maltosyltransferase [uncultured Agrococcus sp.]|uniref:alpha-1,4-glucan--maltose-1-phosphate maltosyltransferase n=1 Tax=uncultured Agrococcus sp. TaxID=382258 RepID=UPI0025E36488|nr:alpha-1,4-glucan--maltose-1-phosphate maltosyltransferase [uncultured Agrococcus sp.]